MNNELIFTIIMKDSTKGWTIERFDNQDKTIHELYHSTSLTLAKRYFFKTVALINPKHFRIYCQTADFLVQYKPLQINYIEQESL